MSWPEDVLYSESDEYLKGFFGSWNRYFRKLLGKKEKKKKRQRTTRITRNAGRVRNVSTKIHVFWVGAASHGECVNRRPGKKN